MMEYVKAQARNMPYVDPALCRACEKCMARSVCRSKALTRVDPGEPPFVDSARCYGCYRCVEECPFGAIIVPGGGIYGPVR